MLVCAPLPQAPYPRGKHKAAIDVYDEAQRIGVEDWEIHHNKAGHHTSPFSQLNLSALEEYIEWLHKRYATRRRLILR